VLTVIAWDGWPRAAARPSDAPTPPRPGIFGWVGFAVLALLVEYALIAFAQVPHMVFLVDYIARGLGFGIDRGGLYLLIYGLGAIAGPLAAGRLADWLGFRAMMRVGFIVLALAVALPLATEAPPGLFASAFFAGALTPGMVSIFVGRTQELVADPDHRLMVWAAATTAYALGLAVAGYLYSFIFAATGGDYRLLFGFGAGAALVALGVDVATSLMARRGRLRPV
jgi:predicted MFS family arabinose efflux permease